MKKFGFFRTNRPPREIPAARKTAGIEGLSSEWDWRKFHKVESPWKPIEPYFSDSWNAYVEHLEVMRDLGFQFVTMTDALDGKVNNDEVNVLLDHHIDFYPIETHVMAAWELQNNFVSNIYVFNSYIGGSKARQIPNWSLEDLDVSFLQRLERSGFEIGYHMNALGLVRSRNRAGHTYSKTVSGKEELEALAQFEADVEALRRYFPLKTYIPHGAGEGNAHLLAEPEVVDPPLRVYNNARFSGRRRSPISWKNFSDSTVFHPNVVKRHGATSVINREPLLSNAYLMEAGFNHELTHPGRYGGGMPYAEFLPPPHLPSSNDRKEIPFTAENRVSFPIDPTQVARGPVPAPWDCQCVATRPSVDGPIFSFSNLPEMIRPHLLWNSRSTLGFLVSRQITDVERDRFRVPRPTTRSLPWDDETQNIRLSFLHNFHFASDPIKFLNKTHFPISCVTLHFGDDLTVVHEAEVRKLVERARRENARLSFSFPEDVGVERRHEKIKARLADFGFGAEILRRQDRAETVRLYRWMEV